MAKLANMELTVLAAKNRLSELLRKAEEGEEVLIRRGRGPDARIFRLVAVEPRSRRTLEPDSRWAGKIAYKDDDLWSPEWKDDAS